MNINQRRLRCGVAVSCLVSAIVAPAASADSIGPNEQVTLAKEAAHSTDPSQSTRHQHIRDGSRAVPFVPWVTGEPPATADDGFDWGDAGVGATATLALAVIAAGTALANGHRPRRTVA
jgi:hypothetical protein